MFDYSFECKARQPVAFLQSPTKLLNGVLSQDAIVCIEVPENRIELNIPLNEESIDVVAKHMVVEIAMPEGTFNVLALTS